MKRRTLARHRAEGAGGFRRQRAIRPAQALPGGAGNGRPRRDPASARRHPDHHHVYVILLDPAVARLRKVRAANPLRADLLPCVYVGMTGLTPIERFANHKAGIKDAWVVKRFGVRLLPELYDHLNPMPFEAAAQMEKDLADDLRRAGYTVTGGY
jgi:hypothetical protein